jgi:APA family basic amino acid/polyamine antiporter
VTGRTSSRPVTKITAQIGILAATAIVVANMVGTGIFTTTGYFVAAIPDPTAVLLGWVVGGVLALCGAAAYAELGAMMPRVGGEYVYLREAFHPWVGFLSGWVSLWAGFSAPIAVSALAFERYLGAVVPGLPDKVPALVLIAAMTALHGLDVVLGSRIQTGFTVAKVLLILAFIVGGLTIGHGDVGHFRGSAAASPGGGGFGAVMTGVFAVQLIYVSFSYSGWNAAAYIAGEIDEPKRNLPRALLLGTGIVMALYVGLNLIYFYAAPPAALAGKAEVGDVAARALFGDTAGNVLSTVIALALISSVSSMVMAGPRVYSAMAEDGMFFRAFAARNRRGAPTWSVLLQGLLAAGIAFIGKQDQIMRYVGFTLSLAAALTVAGVFVLRVRQPDAERPYRTTGYPVTPLVFIAASAWMVYWSIDSTPDVAWWGLGTMLVGVPVALIAQLLDRQTAGASPSG